jgi:hypothetical protein
MRWFCSHFTIENIKEFQTLISGVLAIIAALMGGLFVWYQSRSTMREEDRKRRAKFDAVRATLRHSLSDLSDWAETNIATLNRLFLADGSAEKFSDAYSNIEWKAVPSKTILHFQELIEFGANDNLHKYLLNMLDQVQIIQARLRGIKSPMRPSARLHNPEISSHIEDSMILLTWVDSLFPFADGEESSAPNTPNWNRLPSQCFSLFRGRYQYADLIKKT